MVLLYIYVKQRYVFMTTYTTNMGGDGPGATWAHLIKTECSAVVNWTRTLVYSFWM